MNTGTHAKVLVALLEHLRTLTTDPELSVAWPGVDFPRNGEEKPANFLEVQFLPNQTRQITYGGDAQQLRGILQISVMWKAGSGVIGALDAAGQVIEHFKDQVLFSDDGQVRIVIDREPWASPNLPDGDRMRWPVSIQYHAFEAEAD